MNRYLDKKWTMEKLREEMKRIESDPVNETIGDTIYIYTKKARKKLDEISWAITYLIGG